MIRIGQGYDVHRLVTGRDLYLCGVKVDHSLGLDGHSDADVAIHALCDALLGAIAAGDIGKLFPDNDPEYKGIDSKILLKEVVNRVKGAGYAVGNADITIIAQKPKLAPYIQEMREVMAGLLETEPDRVSVKATTTERLGFEGREEGISAMAVVLIERK
ncbi:MAG: 2-C-methyl-D-erythritol 2,4-cyclodiphosphate synthase [Bacteroidales bacterium]|nr:2-C-methyl-D-erythritol 2,4-cyclodiphosphate synthase [Bacteroidales bacterium]MBD5348838.1 2-C-methyl-D-erythritol 2,4-cyclodiphosphate synthase [Bacteroides sp.]